MTPRPRDDDRQRQEPVADAATPESWDWSRPIYAAYLLDPDDDNVEAVYRKVGGGE